MRAGPAAGVATAMLASFALGVGVGWSVFGEREVSGAPAEASAPGFSRPCRVVDVIDGDTVDVLCGDREERVRLLNVDTPERGQPGYREARDYLSALVEDRSVRLLFETPGQPGRGGFGRLLAYLVSESGSNINLELIRQGWSPYYRKYGDGRFPEAFQEAEEAAREQGSGLWARR